VLRNELIRKKKVITHIRRKIIDWRTKWKENVKRKTKGKE
jgi:hypothetical protein